VSLQEARGRHGGDEEGRPYAGQQEDQGAAVAEDRAPFVESAHRAEHDEDRTERQPHQRGPADPVAGLLEEHPGREQTVDEEEPGDGPEAEPQQEGARVAQALGHEEDEPGHQGGGPRGQSDDGEVERRTPERRVEHRVAQQEDEDRHRQRDHRQANGVGEVDSQPGAHQAARHAFQYLPEPQDP
jgi:hypothetical protein